MVERPRPVIRMTVGMRRKTAVVASGRVDDDSDGVRCTGSLRCVLYGDSRCRLPLLPRWIRADFLHGLEPAIDRVRTRPEAASPSASPAVFQKLDPGARSER